MICLCGLAPRLQLIKWYSPLLSKQINCVGILNSVILEPSKFVLAGTGGGRKKIFLIDSTFWKWTQHLSMPAIRSNTTRLLFFKANAIKLLHLVISIWVIDDEKGIEYSILDSKSFVSFANEWNKNWDDLFQHIPMPLGIS